MAQTSTDLLALFRSEMSDQAEPYLWSDEDIFGYENDAQRMFCRETEGIADATTAAVTEVDIAPGTTWVDLHASIKQLREVYRSDTGRPIEVLNREDMPARRWYFDGTSGAVKALVLGMEDNKARVYPDSNETVTLNLTVFRLPLVDITDVGDQAFEIDDIHVRHLLLWMKYLAYSKQDAETFDRMRAAEFKALAEAYHVKVKEEQRRKRHKVRTVAYGGI